MRKAAEAVTAGHPDKICDQIADAIVDEYLRRDEDASVNVNVLGAHGMVMIGGEVRSYADFDVAALAKSVYAEIGYHDDIEVFTNVETLSSEAKKGLRTATDAAVVNGYATKETREMLPRAFVFANNIARRLDDLRKTDPAFAWILPDGKVQVIMEKDRIVSVTVQTAHLENVTTRDVQTAILDRVVTPVVGVDGAQIFVNPLGAFTKAGFSSRAGTSGAKLASDTYGGLIPHGDSALSGKDPCRVERAASYMARFAARSLVEQGLASSALITAVYSPGRAEPIHLEATGVSEKSRGAKMDYTNLIKSQFDFRPDAIAERLGLIKPIYQSTAAYGHFGRIGVPWEETVK
jgi:S-adenosylmethionine synthetase